MVGQVYRSGNKSVSELPKIPEGAVSKMSYPHGGYASPSSNGKLSELPRVPPGPAPGAKIEAPILTQWGVLDGKTRCLVMYESKDAARDSLSHYDDCRFAVYREYDNGLATPWMLSRPL